MGVVVLLVAGFLCGWGVTLVDKEFNISVAKAMEVAKPADKATPLQSQYTTEQETPSREPKIVPVKTAPKLAEDVVEEEWAVNTIEGNWTAYGIMLFLHQSGADPEWIVDLTAVCLSESAGGDPKAVGDKELADKKWGFSYGLCQIRSLKDEQGKNTDRDAEALTNPRHNLQSAVSIAQKSVQLGKAPLSPWTRWHDGEYRHHLPEVVNAWEALFDNELIWVAGTEVNVSIASQWAKMVAAAKLDGHELKGWGWRSPEKQAQLRVAHCPGVKSMDELEDKGSPMYILPSSSCSPWTAAPGKSAHQSGEVVDIHNWSEEKGRLAGLDSNHPEYFWLEDHGCEYGFEQTVASEPWHWEMTGIDC